jgi:hypothetical protein
MLASFVGIAVGLGTLVAAVSAANWARKAAEETERSANFAEEGLSHAREISAAQLRPYLFIDKLEIARSGETSSLHEIKVTLKNSGITPARNIAVRTKAYLTNDQLMLKAFKRSDDWMTAGTAAPSNFRFIYDGILIGKDAMTLLYEDKLWIVVRVQYRYSDSARGRFTESYDYFMDGSKYDSGAFYLLTPDQIKRMRRKEPDFFADENEPKQPRKN